MPARERRIWWLNGAFVAIAAAAAAVVLPWNRPFDPLLAGAAVVVLALLAGVTFEIGRGFATPDVVGAVPIVFLLPLPLVVPAAILAYTLSDIPSVLKGKTHPDRLPQALTNSTAALGAALALGLAGPDARGTDALVPLAIALLGQWLFTAVSGLVASRAAYRISPGEMLETLTYAAWIDALLWPFGVLVALGADAFAPALLAPLGLGLLLRAFSRERSERYAAALELTRAYRGTVTVLTDVVEAEDRYTADHSRSVVCLASAVADELGVAACDRQELEFAALLHDVGKLAIPREILHKPASLTAEEFELIKTHTIEGERILARAGGLLARVGRVVRSCHERWDGGGYPDGLIGEQIPYAARIVFCCDAYNAMTTDRPYRNSIGREAALREIADNAGAQFDPRVAAALTAVVLRGGHDGEDARVDAVRAVLASV